METLATGLAPVRLTRGDFDKFRSLVIEQRWDWPAVFSINPSGEIWPYIRNGWTPPEERHHIQGLSPIIDSIGEILLSERSLGGRFFIDEDGAWIKPDGHAVPFVLFEFTD